MTAQDSNVVQVSIDLNNAPTTRDAVLDDTFLTAVIGPAGTGKTFTSFQAFLVRAMRRPPAPPNSEGKRIRYSKLVVVRNTYSDLNGSTIPTAREALEEIGRHMGHVHFKGGNEPMATFRAPLPDGTQLDFVIDFVAVEKEDSLKKLLGRAFTYALVDEVSEIPEHVILRLITRAGRYPSKKHGGADDAKVVMVTNGPRMNHFLYKWAMGAKNDTFEALKMMRPDGSEYFKLYRNPPALLRPSDEAEVHDPLKWRPNPNAENIANLPGGYQYYYRMLTGTDDSIKAYVEGDWVPFRDGDLVFPEFNKDLHVIPHESFFLPSTAKIGMSFDFGGHPVCLFWYEEPNGGAIVFDEFMLARAGVDDLMRLKVWPAYIDKYHRPFLDWATGDPSGMSVGQGISSSPYDILKADPYNIPIEAPLLGNRIQPRLDGLHALLKSIAGNGVPAFRVTSNCKYLIDSLSHTYIYKNKRGEEGTKDEPTKSNLHWCSDVADACTYGVQYRAIRSRVQMPTPTMKRHRFGRRGQYGRYP